MFEPALVMLTPSSVNEAVPVDIPTTKFPFDDALVPVCVSAVPDPVTVTSSVPEGDAA